MPDIAPAEADAANNAVLVPGTTYYLSLHTADPAGTGTGEGGAGRQAIVVAASTGGVQKSNTAQSYTNVPGGQTYGWFGVWTAATGGTYLRGGALAANITPPAGSTVAIAAGQITFTSS